MRGLVQRVDRASVTVVAEDGTRSVVGEIGSGLAVLVGVTHEDSEPQARKLADKISGLRIMDDEDGVMNRSVIDVAGEVLIVSQFTLYGDASKGRRPTWIAAAKSDVAEPLVDLVVAELLGRGLAVATGQFRTDMIVEIVNNGPATLMLEV